MLKSQPRISKALVHRRRNMSAITTVVPPTTTFLSNAVNLTDYTRVYSDAAIIASGVVLLTLLIFGLIGNSLTLAVIRNSKALTNGYYIVLGSLCVSDLISAFISILFWYRRTIGFEYFHWPEFFCRLYWAMDLWTSFSTACHIFTFAVLRFTAVQYPIVFKRISHPRKTKFVVAGIWIITFGFGFIPHALFNTVKPFSRLTHIDNSRWPSCGLAAEWFNTWKIYVQFVYSLFIFAPAIGVFAISIAIIVVLQKRKVVTDQVSKKQPLPNPFKSSQDEYCTQSTTCSTEQRSTENPRKKKKKKKSRSEREKDKNAALQLFLIVGSFLFGYIPLTAYHFFTAFTLTEASLEINTFDWRFSMIQYTMLRFSECMNPVFYNLASRKMRRETKKYLRKISHKMETSRNSASTAISLSNEREL